MGKGISERGKLIQIITPVYNTGELMLETYESVKNQTIQDFEWVLVNDGSADKTTLQILSGLEQNNPDIRVIHHAVNKGLPAARNTGIKACHAPFLFFLDADDLIDPAFLEKAWLALQTNPGIAFVNSYVIGFGAQDYKWQGGFHENELFLKENRNTSCFMARREVFKQVLFDESMTAGCEDWDFWLHAASKGLWGYTIPEYLFYYRRSVDNKWATLEGKQSLEQIQDMLAARYAAKLANNFGCVPAGSYSFGFKSPEIEAPVKTEKRGNRHLLCIFPWLQIGGADQYNYNILKGLKNKGWTFTIITTLADNHPWEEKFKELTPDVFHLANLGGNHYFLSYLQYLVTARQPDLVFLSNSMFGYNALPFIKQKFPQLPVTDYVHCEEEGWYNGGYPYFSALYSKLIDRTFTTSAYLQNWCIERGSEPEKLKVCYINVDTKAIKRNEANRTEIRKQLKLSDQTPLILFVARLTEQKQPDVLVETLGRLKNAGAGFSCIIIGEGPDKAKMLQLLEDKKLNSHVHYLGSQSNENVMRYMDAADIFFLPSKYEGIALSVFEAMAKQLAIVGANVGGQAELVSADCGFLVNNTTFSETVKAYTSILKDLLAHPEKVKQLGKMSRQLVEQNFDLEIMVNQMHRQFEELINNQASRLTPDALTEAYGMMLNRMMHLEKDNELLWHTSNSRAVKILNKYRKPYQRLRSVYHKLKHVVKN